MLVDEVGRLTMKSTVISAPKSLSCVARCTPARRTARRRKTAGFTLVEITIVLAIAAIITAISVGAFHEMRAGHKRTACQTNMMQVYQALRLYAADEGGSLPYYNLNCATATPSGQGIGLWSLYTYPQTNNPDNIAILGQAPVERYLRSARPLHCPNDYSRRGDGYINTHLYSEDGSELNPGYLSYQGCDGEEATYASTPIINTPSATNSTVDDNGTEVWKRQLLPFKKGIGQVARPPADDTVVMWCKWHRDRRDFDNVLFYDGTVQLLPRSTSLNWYRVPKAPS